MYSIGGIQGRLKSPSRIAAGEKPSFCGEAFDAGCAVWRQAKKPGFLVRPFDQPLARLNSRFATGFEPIEDGSHVA
jgi:hypothetical protein